MKNFLFISLLLFNLIDLAAQSTTDTFIKKEKLVPPGTVLISDGLYMDEAEVANIHMLEFYYFIKRDSTKEYYTVMLPDTTVKWNFSESDIIIDGSFNTFSVDSTGFMYNSILDQYFLRYPGWRFYPAIGISYNQAKEYCKWRSNSVTISMNQTLEKKRKNYRVNYMYYLPSIDEFTKGSDSTIILKSLKGKILKGLKSMNPDYNKSYEFYYASIDQEIPFKYKNRRLLIGGINFYGYMYNNLPNSKGIYNLYGNVAEMTSDEGISFGGAWIHTKDEILKNPVFRYEAPQSWLGFRCACKLELIFN